MIRVGIGGWTYEPWRTTFYPNDLPQKRALEYASRKVTSIEINGTFYRTQTAATFAKWHDETPENFVFSVKAPRYATNRSVLAEAGESIDRFMASGLARLGAKLGPLLWQFAPFKRFDAEDLDRFLRLLPAELEGRRLRHVLDVRHESFVNGEFVDLARQHGVASVFSDTDEYPSFADVSADFVYARLMRSESEEATGYAASALDDWARRVREWAQGDDPADLPRIEPTEGAGAERRCSAGRAKPRDVFVYFISGAKERAPAAAVAFLSRLGDRSQRK